MNDKVKTIRELEGEVRLAMDELAEFVPHYEHARSDDATKEERFNEGRYGRSIVTLVEQAQATLTQLRMRVQLQLDGRDSARAKQLDRILGIAEEDNDGGGEDE